jgi:hypothetical protein
MEQNYRTKNQTPRQKKLLKAQETSMSINRINSKRITKLDLTQTPRNRSQLFSFHPKNLTNPRKN